MSRTNSTQSLAPKTVQLLDITALSLAILTLAAGVLYLFVLDQFVQNLAVLILCAILSAVTFGTRLKISNATEEGYIRSHLIEWTIACAFLIVFALFIILFYPMGRSFGS